MLTRRRFTTGAIATIAWPARAFASASKLAGLPETFARIEADSGGRLGVGVLDTGTGEVVGHREDERFPMCSTFKFLCAAAILSRVDAGQEQLARRIPVTSADLLDYAPVTKQHAGSDMSVAELCEAAVTLSDNTAANLLLATMGGPSAITQYARAVGDDITRLDRTEPDLNSAEAGDVRDTTTPQAMARNLQTLTLGVALFPPSRDQLNAWLIGSKTGDARLRAGMPKDWRIGDKTGSGAHGTANDIAVIWPTGRAPLIITAYLTQCSAADAKRNAAIAAIGKAVADAIA